MSNESVAIIDYCSARILQPDINSFPEFFSNLASTLQEVFHAKHSVVLDYNPKTEQATVVFEESPYITTQVTVPANLLASRGALLTCTTQFIENIQLEFIGEGSYSLAEIIDSRLQNALVIPIIDSKQGAGAVGAVELYFEDSLDRLRYVELQAFQWLSRALGRALDYLSLRIDTAIHQGVETCAATAVGSIQLFECIRQQIHHFCGCAQVTLLKHDDTTKSLEIEQSTAPVRPRSAFTASAQQFHKSIYERCIGQGESLMNVVEPEPGKPLRCRIATPVRSTLGDPIGVLKLTGILSRENPLVASSWNLRMIESFAHAIGPAIERRWKLTEGFLLRKVIDEAVADAANEQSLDRLLDKTLQTLGSRLRASMGSFYLVENTPSGPELVMRAGIGPDKKLVGRARYQIGEGITGYIAETKAILNFKTREERANHPARKAKYRHDLAYTDQPGKSPAFLGVPILLGTKLLGVWKIEYIEPFEDHPDPYFTPEDERIAELLSTFLAYAIQNGRQQALAHNSRAFATQSLAIEHADTEDEAVLAMIEGLERSSFSSAMISVLDADKVIRGKWYSGKRFERIYKSTVRELAGPDILAVVLRSGKPTLITDCEKDARCDQAAIGMSGLRSQYVLPLRSGDELFGTLQVDVSDHPQLETDQEIVLQAFAGHLSLAIARIRSVHRLDELHQQLTTSARFIIAEELSALVVHSFTRKLDIVLKQLRRDLEKNEVRENRLLREHLSGFKATLETAATDLRAALQSVKAGGIVTETTADVHTEIQKTIEIWHPYLRNHSVRVEPRTKATRNVIDLAPHLMRELISVLLVNATEAFAHNILIETRDEYNTEAPPANFIPIAICIDITDDGQGINSADREEIFESTYTTKKKIGSGLGLFIARRLARRGGGDLIVAPDQPSKGSRFRILLPTNDSGDTIST